MKQNSHPAFAKRKAFGLAIRDAIEGYFKETGLSKTGDWRIWHKAIVLFVSLGIVYYMLVFQYQTLSVSVAVGLCILMSIVKASIGFNVMHDGNHKSFSKNQMVNFLAGFSLNILGGNASLWKKKHNECHHPYTNLVGHDEDVEAPLMRFHRDQSWKPIHRIQFLYWPIMYGLLYFGWIYFTDFKKYFLGKVVEHRFKMSVAEHFIFWGSKILYGYIFVFVPLQHIPLGAFLIGYTVMLFSCGLFIAMIFQLAHIVEEVDQPTVIPVMAEENIYHQISTTANFGVRSRVLGWLCGGLNYQVEHHIVPHVSHVHYPGISKRVRKVCKEFGVQYNEYKTFFSALCSHVKLLFYLGKKNLNPA